MNRGSVSLDTMFHALMFNHFDFAGYVTAMRNLAQLQFFSAANRPLQTLRWLRPY